MVYLDTQVLIFFHGHTILNRGHHTEITVSTVISRHPPNGKQRPFPFTHALGLVEHIVKHTCGAHFLSWSPTLQPKSKKYVFFVVGVIEHFLEANVTSPQI
jgi:hypothetical protein